MTASVIDKPVMGNKRAIVISINANAAEYNVVTGLGFIEYATKFPSSMNSANHHIYLNKTSTATANNGVLGISGLTAGDQFQVICYGR